MAQNDKINVHLKKLDILATLAMAVNTLSACLADGMPEVTAFKIDFTKEPDGWLRKQHESTASDPNVVQGTTTNPTPPMT